MVRVKLAWVIPLILAAFAIAAASFLYGGHTQRTDENRSLASVQAMLAFNHYKTYERIESLLSKKCYDAALIETGGLKSEQLFLLSENIRQTNGDPELVEYIKLRDPKVLAVVLSGGVPEPKPFTTTCP
jgi:hypothetical protein